MAATWRTGLPRIRAASRLSISHAGIYDKNAMYATEEL